jgi:AAA+ superfamily predicted ATPase
MAFSYWWRSSYNNHIINANHLKAKAKSPKKYSTYFSKDFLLLLLSSFDTTKQIENIRKKTFSKLNDIIVVSSDKTKLIHLRTILQQVVDNNTSKMPFILLYGPNGSGKGPCAEALACDSGIPYFSIDANEIIGFGDAAGRYLRNVISSLSSNMRSNHKLLIIKDAFELIAKRNSNNNKHSGLYALLYSLKENNHNLSIILTCSTNLKQIDLAILNRIDYSIGFSLPKIEERKLYTIKRVQELLGKYIEEKNIVNQLKNFERSKDYNNSTRFINSEFSPETYIPSPSSKNILEDVKTINKDFIIKQLNYILQLRKTTLINEFDASNVIDMIVYSSDGWTYQEIDLLLQRVVSTVLGLKQMKVTTNIIIKELLMTIM